MVNFRCICPKCKKSDALGRHYRNLKGEWQVTCHGLNRPEHLGYRIHFSPETGDSFVASDPTTARVLALMAAGEPTPLRGFSEWFLDAVCGITVIPAKKIDEILSNSNPDLAIWAREQELNGFLLAQFPIHRGGRVVGVQFRALRPFDDRPGDVHQIRVHGEADGSFIPHWYKHNPRVVVSTEGPWDAVTIAHDCLQFQNKDIFPVAALSANVSAYAIKSTLDAIFPGVPRFALWDQDPAGVAARMATMGVIKPILVMGAGDGKDYRELNSDVRFECLMDTLAFELRSMGLEV